MPSPMVIQRPDASTRPMPKPHRFVRKLKRMAYDDLRAMADRLSIRPKGTGSHGKIVKKDLITALRTN